MSMIGDFKKFVMRGNVLDLAVGIVIGAAFGKVVSSFVDDILMPPIGRLLGGVDFSNLFVDLSGVGYATLKDAAAAGAPTLRYGLFVNAVISFLIVAFAVFMLVRQVSRFMAPAEVPSTQPCPFCLSLIPPAARRCAHCCAELTAA